MNAEDGHEKQGGTGGGKKRRRNTMPHDEKVRLIEAVKLRPRIWDLSCAQHSDTTAVNASWKEIALELNKTVEECKMCWSSLRDSRRYYSSMSINNKSGDAGGGPLATQMANDSGDWEYSELLSFLPNITKKRQTFKTLHLGLTSPEPLDSSSSSSRYAYETIPTPMLSSTKKCDEEETRISNCLEALVAERQKKSKKYSSSVSYIQDLLEKLPDDRAQELTFNFVSTLQKEILNCNKSKDNQQQ